MKRALILARKGIGRTSPNPAVGCIIVKDGNIIGEGWHRRAGTPHAEIHALNMAGDAAKGADVYVTLEPCCHIGATPPCSDALVKSGVRRVVVGMRDPNPSVSGGGITALNQAGIETVCGVLEDACRAINLPFIKHFETGLPYVTYKCAMTLDGKIASASGDSRWISSEESRKYVHRMRAHNDAVMVGVDTVLADNPQLTVRHVKGRNPLRIIVDSNLRTPVGADIISGALASMTIIACTEEDLDIHQRYIQNGATVLVCNSRDHRVDLYDLWEKLGKLGIQSILLEGGSRLAGDALLKGLIDECVFFYAPKVSGSDGFSPFTITGITDMSLSLAITDMKVRRIGSDIVINARPEVSCLPV